MEKVIQEHLRRNITQFALIIDNIIIRIYNRGETGDEPEDESRDELMLYTFHFNNGGPVKYSYERINDNDNHKRREVIYHGPMRTGLSYDDQLAIIEENDGVILMRKRYGDIVWSANGSLSYEIINLDYTDRFIYYHSNKLTHIENDDILAIYDLKEYLKFRKLPFENGYTFEDLDLILKGDLDLAHRKGKVIAYITEDKKVAMVGCYKHIECSKKIFYEYLLDRRNVKELIEELEKMRENPRSYDSVLLNSLNKDI